MATNDGSTPTNGGGRWDVDYYNVHIPKGMTDEEIGEKWQIRRAAILKRHMMRGETPVPWDVNQSKLAKRYGVAQKTIHKDIEKRLKPYLKEHIGKDAEVETNALLREMVSDMRGDARALRTQGQHEKASRADKRAAQVIEAWWEWMFATDHKDKSADKMELDARMEVEKTERKVYVGVDVDRLPGVDRSQMVGMATAEDLDEEDALRDPEEIEVEDP